MFSFATLALHFTPFESSYLIWLKKVAHKSVDPCLSREGELGKIDAGAIFVLLTN